jgi:hypothetical protein
MFHDRQKPPIISRQIEFPETMTWVNTLLMKAKGGRNDEICDFFQLRL